VQHLLESSCGLSIPQSICKPFSSFFSAWGSTELDGRSFTFWQAGDGLVLDRMLFDKWLLDAAESMGVTVLRGCTITGGEWTPEGWILSGLRDAQQQTMCASFVVEATGARARSVVQPEVKRIFTDALVCISIEQSKHSSLTENAMVEACKDGWWYTVQLPDGHRIVSLFTDSDMVKPPGQRLDWLNSILDKTSHIRQVVNEFPDDTKTHICDARTSIRSVLLRNNWISIGDAAWRLDPLSGIGILRAMQDGINAAPAISLALNTGSWDQLKAYAVSQFDSFTRSLVTQREYYGCETRWNDATFWGRRL
jgi:flavin-dependent dehydrogenase